MIEHRPGVDARVVGRDVLCGFEREAAGEYTEAAKHGLLRRGEQTEAPVERRTQGLMTAQGQPRAGGQDLEALAEPVAQAVHAE